MLAASRSRDGKDDTAIPFVNAIKSLPQRQPVIFPYLTCLQDLRVFEQVYEQNNDDLRSMVGMDTYVYNSEGVNELGSWLSKVLSQLRFKRQVYPQTEVGNVLA